MAPRLLAAFLALWCMAPLPGCGPDFKFAVEKIDDVEYFRRENRSALDSRKPSERTHQFLRRSDLADDYENDPIATLEGLADRIAIGKDRRVAFFLAELCYAQGKSVRDPEQAFRLFASCFTYAYAFLFDPELHPSTSAFDPSFRWACDLYNRSLAPVVDRIVEDEKLANGQTTIPLLRGALRLSPGKSDFQLKREDFDSFLIAYEYDVTGLPGITKNYGLGVPLIAVLKHKEISQRGKEEQYLPEEFQIAVPATVLIRFSQSITRLGHGIPLEVRREAYDPTQTSEIEIAGQTVPLESDLTTHLAYMFQGTRLRGFRGMTRVDEWEKKTGLYMLQPYDEKKIPVIFVHGLMSSPLTWIPLFNDLMVDETLRERYQFWFFMYPTGNPIILSASILRGTLRALEDTYDPLRTNPYFQNTVLCGHSMGGLLSKLQVFDSRDRLWKLFTDVPIDQAKLSDKSRELAKRVFFFERQTFLKRLVLMATPNRGSTIATGFIGQLGARMIRLPRRMVDSVTTLRHEMLDVLDGAPSDFNERQLTGIDNLSPNNRILLEMATWKFDTNLPVHCIIGNRDGEEAAGTDGIVPYESSHLDDVTSELVIRSDHSVHRRPRALIELRRILLLHLQENPALRDPPR